jgi:hypothetical protein
METKTISVPPKFMRPRVYAPRVGIDWPTCYRYIQEGLFPAYKFQGVLLLDVEECDSILKGLIRHVAKPMKRQGKAGRPRKFNPPAPEPAAP